MWGSSHPRSGFPVCNHRRTVLAVLCVVLPLTRSERLTAATDVEQDDDEAGTHGQLSLSDVRDVKVERITQRERLEYRSRGMRFHDVSHKHFGGDGSALNVGSMVQKAFDSSSDQAGAEEAGASKCPAAVLQEWKSIGFLIKATSDGHADVTCKGSSAWSPHNTAAVSCRPTECGGGAWCFVEKGCWRCRRKKHFNLQCEEPSEPAKSASGAGAAPAAAAAASAPRSTNISTQLAPPLEIAPSQVSGNVCVQFDLDLTVISGGTFPGLIGVGLLGEVHRIPATRCYGWTLELYLQFSIGFDVAGVPFRLSFVFTGTLMVTEQPLDAAKSDLKWKLPFAYDTSICHTADPFVLVARTFKRQWRYVRTHILTFRTISHTEEKVRQALKDSNAASNMVNYVKLLVTEEKGSWRTLAGLTRSVAALASPKPPPGGGLLPGKASVGAAWASESGGLLNVSFTAPQRSVSDTTAFSFRLWQRLGPVTLLHRSPITTFGSHGSDVAGAWLVRVRERSDVAGVIDFFEHGRVSKAAEFTFTWPEIGPEHTRSRAPIYRAAEAKKGTLGIESIEVEMTVCGKDYVQPASVVFSVRSEESPTARWTREQFGGRFPWGARVDNTGGVSLPQEAVALFSHDTPVVSLEGLSTQGILMILHEGANKYPSWAQAWAGFLSELRHELRSPTARAARLLAAGPLRRSAARALLGAEAGELRARPSAGAFLGRLAMEMRKAGSPGASSSPPPAPAAPKFRWATFGGRSVSPSECSKVGLDDASEGSDSAEACAEKCRAMRPRSCLESPCSAAACNAALYDKTDSFCSFWHCEAWDGFPSLEGYDLVAMLPDADLGTSYDVEKILGEVSLEELLRFGIRPLQDDELAQLIEDVATLAVANSTWETEVFDAVFPADATSPSAGQLSTAGAARITDALAACLGQDSVWEGDAHLVSLLTQNLTRERRRGVAVELEVTDTRGNVGRKLVGLGAKLFEPSNQWLERQTISLGRCRARVDLQMKWQMRKPRGYFQRPKMVPVAQALFAAYDQFVSKIPAYAEQALERLQSKVEEGGRFTQFFKQILPYDTTDGRFLHRYLRKGEKDKLKVHEGDLGTDDAVFNFPKALAESRHRGTSAFKYNAGLSVANLFIRILSDVQALFFLYFANHPDWDGECASLPAKFHLFYEHSDAGPAARPRQEDASMPNFRAGETVGKRGQPLTHDDQQLVLGWHWVAKPHWFYKHSSRAKFFTRTPPVHGKDKWASTELAELSAVMWPHVWCELVEQHWVKVEAQWVSSSMKGNLIVAEQYAAELLDKAPNETGKYSARIREIMQRGKESLKVATVFSCEEKGSKDALAGPETLRQRLQDLRDFWDLHAHACTAVLEFYEELLQKMREEVEVDTDETEEAKGGASKLLQVEKLEGTLQATKELLDEEGASLDAMARSAIESLAKQNRSDQDGILDLARRRQDFESAYKGLEIALAKKQDNFIELQSHLARLLDEYPWSNSSSWSGEDLNDARRANSYTNSFWGVVYLQASVLAENKVLFSCIGLLHRPKVLAGDRFEPWVRESVADDRVTQLMTFIEPMKALEHASNVDTIELFFDEACRVPPGYDFKSEMVSAGEPRPECERLFLSKAFVTIFHQFTTEAMQLYQNFTKELQNLRQEPNEALVKEMLERLVQFVRGIDKTMDDDFYTAFGYGLDGSLFGELWSSLPDSTTKILASLDQRTRVRQKWITESIEAKAQLKESRRMRVRSPVPDKPEIPTEVGGCVCMEDWAAFVWRRLPRRTDFHGCTSLPLDGHISGAGDMTGWPGLCRAQQKRHSLEDCAKIGKLVRCDPALLQDTRPTYKLWRRNARKEYVTLPLVHMNLYLTLDVQSARADFCTPNFAPLLIKKTLHWSVLNWLRWEMRTSTCHGAWLHPPGASLLTMRCTHSKKNIEQEVYEWHFVMTAYIISYYNVWGSSDGDTVQSWFSKGGSSSWASTAAQQGFPGILTANSMWSNADAGFGYLSTESVVTSPAGFWFAVASEAMAVFALSGAASPGEKQEGKSGDRWRQVMFSSATAVWRVLQRFAVVPQSWTVSTTVRAATKHLSQIVGVTFSPFRNEHDVILAMKYEKLVNKQARPVPKLIEALGPPQLRSVMEHGRSIHPSWDEEWRDYQETHSSEDPENLARSTLVAVLQSWAQKVALSERSLRNLFQRCPRRPRQYQVREQGTVWPFFAMAQSAWMKPALEAGTTLFLIETGPVGSGWLVQVTDEAEEERYFPDAYISLMELTVIAEFVDTPTRKPLIAMQEGLFVNGLLKRADLADLRCWARAALQDLPRALGDAAAAAEAADGSMAGYYAPEYLQKFVLEQWSLLSGNASAKQRMSSLFLRGPLARASLNVEAEEEEDWFHHQSFAVSLSLLFRIGLPFMNVPLMLQVQPYVQFSVAYDVVDIFKSVWARVADRPERPTPLQRHEARVRACRRCIDSGQAFCDRRRAASNMLRAGFNATRMDRCMPKTAAAKAECKAFEWDTRADSRSVYKKQVCPCYEHRGGTEIRPRWITSGGHCDEIRFPQDWSEDGRRRLKKSDFKLGFAWQAAASGRRSLVLGDKLAYDGVKGCREGFRCCGATVAGKEVLRCVHLESIAQGSWFTRSVCKNYEPKDVRADGNWKHVRQEFRCAPVDAEASAFDGHWRRRSGPSGDWERLAAAAA